MADYDPSQIGEDTGDAAFTRTSPHGGSYEATYAGATSFLRCQYTRDLADFDIAVSGVPFDLATTGRPGARLGPRAVREASVNLAWDQPQGWGFNPLDKLKVADWGDSTFDPGRPETWIERLEAHASAILATDTAMLTLGGDHFISYPMIKSPCGKTRSPVAHPLRRPFGYLGRCRRPHRSRHHVLSCQGAGAHCAGDLGSGGIRTHNPKTHGFNILDASEVCRTDAEVIAKQIKTTVGETPVYLTFDIDCLDPAYAPGTGTPCAGGLTTRQALDILRSLEGINLVGMDVVEVAPAYDVSEITALAGATIAYQMLALYAARP